MLCGTTNNALRYSGVRQIFAPRLTADFRGVFRFQTTSQQSARLKRGLTRAGETRGFGIEVHGQGQKDGCTRGELADYAPAPRPVRVRPAARREIVGEFSGD